MLPDISSIIVEEMPGTGVACLCEMSSTSPVDIELDTISARATHADVLNTT